MSLLVAGTLAYDSVETPAGKAEEILGGAATYFAVGASFFGPVRLVGIVGEDFKPRDRLLLERHGVLLDGLAVAPGKTFRWSGKYLENMVDRETLRTDLNVFGDFDPKLPPPYRTADYLFLANGHTALQLRVLDLMEKRPKFVVADTMNLWIRTTRPELDKLLGRIEEVRERFYAIAPERKLRNPAVTQIIETATAA